MPGADGALGCDTQHQLDMHSTGLQMYSVHGMHAVTDYDTTSFQFSKGKVLSPSVLQAGDFPISSMPSRSKMPCVQTK